MPQAPEVKWALKAPVGSLASRGLKGPLAALGQPVPSDPLVPLVNVELMVLRGLQEWQDPQDLRACRAIMVHKGPWVPRALQVLKETMETVENKGFKVPSDPQVSLELPVQEAPPDPPDPRAHKDPLVLKAWPD